MSDEIKQIEAYISLLQREMNEKLFDLFSDLSGFKNKPYKTKKNPGGKVMYFNSKEEADNFEKDHISPVLSHQTPNCAVCRWKGEGKTRNGLGQTSTYENCTAQAYKISCNCYNSDECKALFESMEPVIEGDR